jgi:hypothetical protein
MEYGPNRKELSGTSVPVFLTVAICNLGFHSGV